MNPYSLYGNSRDLGIGKAAMSADQSPLAMSSEVCSSGWTVCYSSDKSDNSAIAIS